MGFLDNSAAIGLNFLLRREAWARERLAPFAGEVVEIRPGPLPPLRLEIAADGQVAEPAEGAAATLTITTRPEFPAALARGEEHLMRAVDIVGNAQLATEILALMRYLRWDLEEDLSRVFGDAVAHRVVGTLRDLAAWQKDAVQRLADNVMEYAIEERRMVVTRTEFEAHAAGVAKLRDDLARLEQRMARLGRATDRQA